jgi:hypothetical protein
MERRTFAEISAKIPHQHLLGKMSRNFEAFPVNTILVSSRNALATLPASAVLVKPQDQ